MFYISFNITILLSHTEKKSSTATCCPNQSCLQSIAALKITGSRHLCQEKLYSAMASNSDKGMGFYSNINTIRNTQWSLNTWNEWRTGINNTKADSDKDIPSLDELPTLELSEMDELLTRFIEDIRTPEGNDYPPDSIRNILYGIQRHIRLTIPDINLFEKHSKNFKSFRDAYSKKIKEITAKGVNSKKRQAQAVSEELEKKLWDKGAFRFHNAIALSNAVFFYTSKVFGLIAGESLRKLDTKHFRFGEDDKGKYIELDGDFAQSVCCRHHKVGMDPEDGSIRHYQIVSNQRCYYNLMVHYLKQIRKAQLDGPLFLKPMQDKCFSNQALGENNLASKLSQIMKTYEIDGYYTNHSIILAVSMKLSSKGISLRKLHGSAWNILEISKLLDPPAGVVMETEAILVPVTPLSNTTATGSFLVQQQGTQFILQQKPGIFSQAILPSMSLPITATSSVQQALRNKLKPGTKPLQPKIKAENLEDQMVFHSNSKAQNKTIFPLYLSAADSTSNMSHDGPSEEQTETTEELNQIIHSIKEEPADDYGFYGTENTTTNELEDYEQENSNDTNNSEISTAISSTYYADRERNSYSSGKRKRKQSEPSESDRTQPKTKIASEISLSSAEVVLTFSRNLNTGVLKQEVEVNDNNQDVFTSSSTYKTGRPIPDFDLSLGDFLPEHSVIRPRDIKIKRVATPNGGKIVLDIKYSNTD